MGFQATLRLFACLDTDPCPPPRTPSRPSCSPPHPPAPSFWLEREVACSKVGERQSFTEVLGESTTLLAKASPFRRVRDYNEAQSLGFGRVCSLQPEEDRVLPELEKRGNPDATPAGWLCLQCHGARTVRPPRSGLRGGSGVWPRTAQQCDPGPRGRSELKVSWASLERFPGLSFPGSRKEQSPA